MIILGATESTDLAWEVSKQFKSELGKLEVKRFPDGEFYVKVLTDVRGKECAVVKSTTNSDDLIELFLLIDALKDGGATQVHAVIPYLLYMRQDKKFTEGEALSAKTVLKLLHELADDVTTINCHFLNEGGDFVKFNTRIRNLNAVPLLTDYFRDKLVRPVVIAPDKGSMAYAKMAAEQLDCEFNQLQKKRISGREVVIRSKELKVEKRDVLILDDIIATGGTIAEAAKVVRGWKPLSVNVGCVHGLFLNGVEQFKGTVDRLVCTNTMKTPVSKVSVAKLIADDLQKL